MSAALGLITVRSETPQHRMMAERERGWHNGRRKQQKSTASENIERASKSAAVN